MLSISPGATLGFFFENRISSPFFTFIFTFLYTSETLKYTVTSLFFVKRCVLSPESDPRDMPHACVIPAERIVQQSTPLFISVTKPAADDPSRLVDAKGGEFTSFELDGLWITTRVIPKTFPAPSASITRIDLSWDPEVL